MYNPSVYELDGRSDELFTAGQIVSAGVYRRIGTNMRIQLHEQGHLPASLDGRVACYELIGCAVHPHCDIPQSDRQHR